MDTTRELYEQLVTLFHSTPIEISAEKEARRIINLLAKNGYGKMVQNCDQYKEGMCKQTDNYCTEDDCIYCDSMFAGLKEIKE